jgi:hypothetical protein
MDEAPGRGKGIAHIQAMVRRSLQFLDKNRRAIAKPDELRRKDNLGNLEMQEET